MEISFTKLRVFRECPWKYKLLMVDGWRIPATPSASLGRSLHRALECFHRKPTPAPEDLWECYESRWFTSGYPDEAARQAWFEKGRRMLELYLESERERRTEVVAVEREFLYPLGRHEVRGMIDRIDRHPDGRVEVIDYKTSGTREVLEPSDELQLRFYGLGCRESLALEAELLTVHFLAAGRRVSIPYDAAGEAAFKEMIRGTADRIETGAFAPDTTFCPRCDFRNTCVRSACRDTPPKI